MISGHWYSGPGQTDVPAEFLTATGTAVGDNGLVTTPRHAKLPAISDIQHWPNWRRLHQGEARHSRCQRRVAAEGGP